MGKALKNPTSSLILISTLCLMISACGGTGPTPLNSAAGITPIPTIPPTPTLVSIPSATLPSSIPEKDRIPVLMLQDGAPDDITAATYLMLDNQFSVKGIVVVNGETHPSIALKKWNDFVYAFMGRPEIQVVAGCDCAVDPHANAFPTSWRDSADNFWGVTLPEYSGQFSTATGKDLILSLADQYPHQLVVVITGPLTDMALALRDDPTVKNRIKRIVMMGGAVDVPGNIHTDDPTQSNLTADWQIWVDPQASADVFSSGIPMDIIPMDTVPEVELHRSFAQAVEALNQPAAKKMAELWQLWMGWRNSDFIWIYDVLSAISTDHPDLYTWINAPLTVVTDLGPDQGRLLKGNGPSDYMRYASHANAQGVLDTLFAVFSPASVMNSTDSIAGDWSGTIISDSGGFSTAIDLTIRSVCKIGSVCGSVSTPQLSCSGDLFLNSINGGYFEFIGQNMNDPATCTSGGTEILLLNSDGTLSFKYQFTTPEGTNLSSSGLLFRK